jgi:hypothetical protein
MKKYWKHGLLVILALLLFSPSGAWGQSIVTGGVAGIVTDASGAVVVGAKLTLKSIGTGETFSATSSATGDFVFALLKPGDYALSTVKEGFKTSTRNVTVLLGTTVSASVSLEVGSSTMTVEVTGTEAQLQTENANISTNFETKQIQQIPNPGGDVTYVAQTAPGVSMSTPGGGGYGNFSTFGLPGTANLFTINGNDYNDPFLNLNNSGSSNLLLGGNELQEVNVTNNAYTGQYGRQAGSQIDYTTKSGTNAFHGDAVYDWTGRFLNANDPINIAGGGSRPFENNNQWAASLGGPIIKDKAFFFVNTEGIRYIFGSVHPDTIPTPAFQTYVLGNIPPDAATQAFYTNLFKLWNNAPNVGRATPNGLPATGYSATSPQGAGSCTGFPFTTDPTTGATTGFPTLPASLQNGECTESWTNTASSGNKEWLLSGRVDYSFSDNDKLFGRVKFDRGVQPTYTDFINSAFDTFSTQPQDEGQINYTHLFSPTVVNNFIGNVLYYSAIFGSIGPGSPALNLIPGNLAFTDGSLTNLGFGAGFGGYANGFLFPQGRNVTQWGLVDDLSITRGNHAFKMGVNFRRDDISDHTAAETTVYPAVNTTLVGFADDAAVSGVNYNFTATPVEPVAIYSFGLYFQDEFRATSKLKFTLTLRADRNSGGVCQHHCAGLPVDPFYDLAHGADIPYDQSFQTGLKTDIPGIEMVAFQPRFGVAWTPWGSKTVIRAGVGLFSDLYPGVTLSAIDTNFPQVNLWNVPDTAPGSLAWDLKPAATTAFPNSGLQLVEQCNAAFTNNYNIGGTYNTYVAAAPNCTSSGQPLSAGAVINGALNVQDVPALNDVSRNLQNPKYVEWNLEVQHMLTPHTILSVNYVGNRGFDELYYNDDLNGYSSPFAGTGVGNAFSSIPQTAPLDPRVGRVNELQSGAISNYNGVTFSIQENSWHGLSGRLNYTYSHALDEISNGGVLPFAVYYSIPAMVDPFNLRANYASADYDARHLISGSYIYALPFKSSNHLLNEAISGWQLSGTMFYRTGYPFSVFDNATTAGLAAQNLTGATILLQPEFSRRNFSNVGACITSNCFGFPGSGAPYIFSPATDFTNPVVGRNAFRGPGFLGGDMSIRKDFRITERVSFQLGLNAYNWFNHANYAAPYPGTLFGPSNFGAILLTQTPPTSPYGAFAAAATDMRMAQIQGKLTF